MNNLLIENNVNMTKKFTITMFDCNQYYRKKPLKREKQTFSEDNKSSHEFYLSLSFIWPFKSLEGTIWIKVWELEKYTKLNTIFCLIKSSEIVYIFLPAFDLIIWLMTWPKNFEKIAILKIWELISSKVSKFTSANSP